MTSCRRSRRTWGRSSRGARLRFRRVRAGVGQRPVAAGSPGGRRGQRLHELTGLSVQYLKRANLRVNPSRFRKELLRDERRTVGRYDGRFEGIDFDAAGEEPSSDPSQTAIEGAFTAAFNSYLARELNYSQDTPYRS